MLRRRAAAPRLRLKYGVMPRFTRHVARSAQHDVARRHDARERVSSIRYAARHYAMLPCCFA